VFLLFFSLFCALFMKRKIEENNILRYESSIG